MRARRSARSTYHHGDLHAALLRSAVELIERGGVAAFTMKDAARAALVAPSAPYRHFADRETLLAAVSELGFDELRARLVAVQQKTSGPTQLEELALAYVRFARERPAHFRVMFEGGLDKAKHPRMAAAGARTLAILLDTVRTLVPRARAQKRAKTAAVLWSLIHGFALLDEDPAFVSLSTAPERVLRAAVRQLIAGM